MLEDDRDDRSLVKETLLELSMDVPITFFNSGDELLRALSSGKPSLILLDYNAQPDNGIEVLRKIKMQQAWKNIPVVILCDNAWVQYKDQAYEAGASSFIKKPDTLDATRKKIGTFFSYWLDVAETPSHP